MDYLNLLVAAADFAVAGYALLEFRRLRIRIPPVGWALVGYFAVRGSARLNDPDPFLGFSPGLVTVFDAVSLVLLVVLVANARRLARAAVATVNEAGLRAREYERARRDYAALIRHRLFNPLTVIRGAAQTLARGAPDEQTRAELLAAIVSAADALERTAADPEVRGPEEAGLDPVPRVDE